MQNDFSKKTMDIINAAIEMSNKNNISTAGSEYLILAMYDTQDSLCHFILDEYDVKREEIVDVINDMCIIRKKTDKMNKVLQTIMHQAQLLAGDKMVDEEHIFMAVLMNPNSIAANVLIGLGLDIESLISDVKEIYEFDDNKEMDFTKNITELAKKHELTPFIGREELLKRLELILNRKTKSNPLLVGNAGVGKTALVEGFASLMCEKNSDIEIISLNLTAMLAGTKYRGDFEQRFNDFTKKIITKKNIILFIDEIHTIMGAGTTEGNLDIANMLKPYLARSDIKIIGATTLEEYHKTMEQDKALCRRFQLVYILEPSINETKKILYGIRPSYLDFHKVSLSDEMLDYILEESNRRISLRYRPDKCIDVLDDVLTYSKLNNVEVTKKVVDETIFRFIGCSEYDDSYEYKYPQLEKYGFLSQANLLFSKSLLKIKYFGNNSNMDKLINDCIHIFKSSKEMVLELDFKEFSDSIMTTSLIGAPPGYVGYDDEGILTKHLSKYQIPIICIYNFEQGSFKAKGIINHLMNHGELFNANGKLIKCSNAVFILQFCQTNTLGFAENTLEVDDGFDEIIYDYEEKIIDFTLQYKKQLQSYNIELANELVITKKNKKVIDEKIFEIVKNNNGLEKIVINE